MAFEAQLLNGDPLKIDYTPSGASVAAGEIVVLGELPLVAARDIADGRLGALNCGGAVYRAAKTPAEAVTVGATLYFDAANNRLTTTASTHKKFGYAGKAALAADTHVEAIHKPGG